MKIRTQFTYKQSKGTVNNSPAETEQGMALSVKELNERASKGIPLGSIIHTPEYDKYEPEFDDIVPEGNGAYDLTDIDELHRKEEDINRRLQETEKRKRKLERERKRKEAVERKRSESEHNDSSD